MFCVTKTFSIDSSDCLEHDNALYKIERKNENEKKKNQFENGLCMWMERDGVVHWQATIPSAIRPMRKPKRKTDKTPFWLKCDGDRLQLPYWLWFHYSKLLFPLSLKQIMQP